MISSALKDNLVSFTQVWQSFYQLNLSQSPIDSPICLERFVLTLALSFEFFLKRVYSNFSTLGCSLTQVPSTAWQTCKTIWERDGNVTHTFVGKDIVLQKSSEERYKETQVLLTLKFKITSLCRKWSNSLLICFPYIVFSPYPKSILRVVVNFHFHRY